MLFTATKNKKEIIAFTDKFGYFNIFGTGGFFKSFRSFEEVKNNYKCFKNMSDLELIDYDLSFRDFIEQFESGAKEADCLDFEIAKWKRFKKEIEKSK